MSVVIELVKVPNDDARALITELDAELSCAYAAEQRHGLSVERLFQPHVLFFVAKSDGEAVGCGGVAFLGDFGEIKRMYVRPKSRRQGVAHAILRHLERQARARGISRLVLETGDAQHAAIRIYEREGFTRCTAFGDYARMPPGTVERSAFFEKRITYLDVSRAGQPRQDLRP